MKQTTSFVVKLSILSLVFFAYGSTTHSTITYAQNSQEPTTSLSQNSAEIATSDAIADRLNTLAGIWIQAQNLKKELEDLAEKERSTTNEERAIAKIVEYSIVYDVPAKDLYSIVKCESNFNPNARNLSEKEDSWSWVQINRKAHPHISVSQTKDLNFAISFLAKNWSEGRQWMWKNCAERLKSEQPT